VARDSPYIVHYVAGYLENKNNLKFVWVRYLSELDNDNQIVMQYCDLGSLSSYLKIKPFQEAEIAIICKQSLLALSFLHSFGVVHRFVHFRSTFPHFKQRLESRKHLMDFQRRNQNR
jgi:serine/threonine protein kinase